MTELESSAWSFILLLMGAFVAAGILADKMWGWLWSEKLSALFNKKANKYLDKHFIKIMHEDLTRIHKVLEVFFGKGFFSFRLVAISIIPAATIVGIAFLFEVQTRGVGIDTESLFSMVVMVGSNFPIDLISLLITRYLLSKSKPFIGVVLAILVIDITAVYFLMPLPYTTAFWYRFLDSNSASKLVAFTFSYAATWPADLSSIPSRLQYSYEYINYLGLCLVFFTAALPTLLYLFIIIRDILHLVLLKWLYLGFAGLFSYLASKEYPLTVIFTGIAVIIPLVKLLKQSMPYLEYVLK